HLINRLIYENGVLFSSTEYYENGNLKYESIQNIKNMNLEFLEWFLCYYHLAFYPLNCGQF
ncbi:hypothetical protein ACTPEF_27230, partial [Clostridioides difficile]